MANSEEDLLTIFEAVGGRLRARFVMELRAGPYRPSKLSHKLNAPLSNLYRIFNELKDAKLVESIENDGIVFWRLTEFGRRWIEANVDALSEKATPKGSKNKAFSGGKKHFISASLSLLVLLLAIVRGVMLSQPTYITGGLILAFLIFVILEKVK
ncbi:MAG: winged helix-turn-helix domain-containing protein [Nitrososphaeria archaeon]